HPEHGSDAPAVSWSVSESGPVDQVSAGTAGSRKVRNLSSVVLHNSHQWG
ncbi:hypothetical protein A2U01_0109467, partial [Trifolium medium]|nr:hypothetical protein [Trifolium medium]